MNGPETQRFEHWLAEKNHAKYAITCHSGTQALEVIAEYYKSVISINPPTVLIPSLTYVATANAFIRAGWNVHFIDTDSRGIIDINKIPDVSFQAIVLVGLYGAAPPHANLLDMWKNRRLTDTLLIEDGAQHWLGNNCHRIGTTAISFDPMKNLPCYGNGGAVITNDYNLTMFVKQWRQNGNTSSTPGTNSRMSELDCALMLVKSQYIDNWQLRREKIAKYWIERLKGSSIRCLIDETNITGHAFHKFVIEVDRRNHLQQELQSCKIETKIHYAHPLHEVGLFSQYDGPGMLSCTSSLARRVLSLPIYPELTDGEVEYIIDQVLIHA